MEVPFAQSLEVARRTQSASGTVVWNLAPVLEQMTSEMIRDLLASTDYLLVNEHEALDFAAAIALRVVAEMLTKARERGWIDIQTNAIRAHVERELKRAPTRGA